MQLKEKTRKTILEMQESEITEHFIYKKLAEKTKETENKKILEKIAKDELKHYEFWKKLTGKEVQPDKFKIQKYYLISKIFGLTFGIKLMENGEEKAQQEYEKLLKEIPEVKEIIKDENEHERKLINLLREEKLEYVGSIVLGLNDALVELTGALAGLTLVFQNSQLIAVAGLITGIAASLSMAASEYLSKKTEENFKNPLKASVYTGTAYVFTVLFLILPYFVFSDIYVSLISMLINAIIIIFIFTFYISVAKDLNFKHRFFEMAGISLGVALITFLIGFIVRYFLNIEV